MIVYSKDGPGLELGTPGDNVYTVEAQSADSPGDMEDGGVKGSGVKTSKQRFRFNLIFNLVLWILVPLPFWLQYVVPFRELALWILFSIQGSFSLFWLVVLVLGNISQFKRYDKLMLLHFYLLKKVRLA
jgi:hypothetical protein